jgi:hypothetical protein
MMCKPWPEDKEERQAWELDAFCSAYNRNSDRRLVPISRGDRPDAIVRDQASGDEFGVELTSVYLNDRSVPDHHKVAGPKVKTIPYDHAAIQAYMLRILDAIESKTKKAHSGYDPSLPLILSIYLNEYDTIHVSEDRLDEFLEANDEMLDRCQIFSEIVLWPLGNHALCRIKPGQRRAGLAALHAALPAIMA